MVSASKAGSEEAGRSRNAGAEPLPMHCTRHPNRETWVSCGRCGRPFCPECLVHTPAGQRCYECAGVHRDSAQRAAGVGLAKVAGIAALGALIGSLLGSLLFVLFAGLIAGGSAGQTLSPSVNRHSRGVMYALGAFALIAGALIGWLIPLLIRSHALSSPDPFGLLFIVIERAILSNLAFWLYVGIAAAIGYQRIR